MPAPTLLSQQMRNPILALLGLLALRTLVPAFAGDASAVMWQPAPGGRSATLPVVAAEKPGFTLLPATATGLVFTNRLDEWSGAANRVLYNGSGLAAGDYDGDGWVDLFFCNLSGQNALFRNLGGWRFENVTASAGLLAKVPATRGAVFADINGDSYLDLLTSVTGRGVLTFLNNGQGKFTDATAAAGTGSTAGSTTMALADVDGNGTLDLYIANYRPDDIRDRGRARVTLVNGRPVMAGTETNRFLLMNGRLEECGQPDQLLLNDGKGRFRPVPWTAGAFLDEEGRPLSEPPPDWGLTATFRDLNGDLAPELYVCNDYWTPDRFWINDGSGRFRAIPRTALRRTSASSMAVDFADVDRDGYLDFFVVDMLSRYPHLRKRQMLAQSPTTTPIGQIDDRPQIVQNTFFLNRRDGSFAEVSGYAGLAGSDWSWAPVFLDVDLDGYEDLLIGAGHFRDVQDYDAEAQVRARQHAWDGFPNETERQRAFTKELMEHYHLYPFLRMPIGAFRNLGAFRFAEITEAWGLNQPGVHQGLVFADFDRDGDQDLAVNNLNDSAALYRNDSGAPRVAVRLRGATPNTQAIGATVVLSGGQLPRQTAQVICGGRYQSGADTQVTFAAGSGSDLALAVTWRSGRQTQVAGVQPNRLYELVEPGEPGLGDNAQTATAVPATVEPKAKSAGANDTGSKAAVSAAPPWFAEVSERVSHRHVEAPFDDYDRQPLLPFKLSQMGPGVAWLDMNGDGHDDLVVGSGRGGRPAVFLGDGKGQFQSMAELEGVFAPDDTAGLAGWVDSEGRATLLAAVTGYETGQGAGLQTLRTTDGKKLTLAHEKLPLGGAGALALGDMNGDGRLVLFVAGGVAPGRYPLGEASKLFRLQGDRWMPDDRNNVLFENLGIVNGALWSDLDGDGFPELVLACEWGPIRVFRTRGGALTERTEALGLAPHTGWWRGVTAVDLNNDGRLDLVASNWGQNSPYRASPSAPLTFIYGELFQPGVTEIMETEYVGQALHPRRQFMALANAMPFLFERFTSHKAFSEANLGQVLGERLPLGRKVTVSTLASTVFLNLGNGFQARPLPWEAQLAPAFSVNAADFDGDGNEDLFLSQNFFATQPETPRMDAGCGLWLRGDGKGNLTPLLPAEAGTRVLGEQRGAAVADFDEDGRPDLVVTQNGAATRLLRNVGARPGLRVRLQAPSQRHGVLGAVMRLEFEGGSGPAREIHAGSGYWSQDSFTQILALPAVPKALWVRWPGGRVTTTPLPAGARSITVDSDGKLVASR